MAANKSVKKLIRIDVSSDNVCPWSFVAKTNMEKAMSQTKDRFDFEVRWHPYFLNPTAPKEGMDKIDFYKGKFGVDRWESATSAMKEVYRGVGLVYNTAGRTGSTLDSHRLITFAAHQGYVKQNALVGELFLNYFTQGKFIGERQVLLDAARRAGIEGAAELLDDPSKCLDEVYEEIQKYSTQISGVPHIVINGKYELSGGQPPEVFVRVFQAIENDSAR